MSGTEHAELAARIEATVRAMPGVSAVYRAGGAVAVAVDAGARLLGVRDEDAPLVALRVAGDAAQAEIAIGVRADHGAAATAREVHRAVRALLTGQGRHDVRIRLTVVHVDEAAAATVESATKGERA